MPRVRREGEPERDAPVIQWSVCVERETETESKPKHAHRRLSRVASTMYIRSFVPGPRAGRRRRAAEPVDERESVPR